MFINVSPTFCATSTKEGNPSSAPSRKDVPRTNGSQRKFEIGRILHLKSEIRNLELDSVQFTISAFGFEVRESSNFKFSSPDSRLDFHEQLLVLAVFFVEYDCTLRCLQSIGKLADFQIS